MARRPRAPSVSTGSFSSNTSCHYPNPEFWNERIKLIRANGGLAPVADRLIGAWFTREFRERAPATVERMRAGLAATPMEGYIACGEAVRDMDHRDILSQIKAPTLVIIGRHDPATTPEAGRFIHSRIPRAAARHDRRRPYFQYRAANAIH